MMCWVMLKSDANTTILHPVGLAVAVASDEANNGSGRVDPWKRERLLGVGAHVVIPDYRDADSMLRVILGS
mgnify:CR=1 FL=1